MTYTYRRYRTDQINTATLHHTWQLFSASQWQGPTLGPEPPDFCLRPSSSISLHGAISQTSQTDNHPALILIVHTQYWFQLNLKFLANIVNIATWTNMFIISSNIVSYFTGDFFLSGPGVCFFFGVGGGGWWEVRGKFEQKLTLSSFNELIHKFSSILPIYP